MCTHCARGCTRPDLAPHAPTGPFRRVRPVHVCVGVKTEIHVPAPSLIGVYALGTYAYLSERGSTCPYRPFSVRTPFVRACKRLNGEPRACTGQFQCLRPVHRRARACTWIHVLVPAPFHVYTLCTCVHASGRGTTCLYRPVPACTSCKRACSCPKFTPRACSGPFRCLGSMHECVRIWKWFYAPIPSFFRV